MPAMSSRFGILLQALLARQALTGAEFSRRVGISRGFPSSMIAGRFRPPAKEATLVVWASVLALNDEESELFITAALLEHTPPRIAEDYRRLRGL